MGYGQQNPTDPRPHDSRSIHHFWHPTEPMVKVKLIKNTRGYSYEATAEAPTPSEVANLLQDIEAELEDKFHGLGE